MHTEQKELHIHTVYLQQIQKAADIIPGPDLAGGRPGANLAWW